MKKVGDELDLEPQIEVINNFLDQKIQHYDEYLQKTKKQESEDVKVFDKIFLEALKEVWG